MRKAWGLVLAAVLVGATGCGDDDPGPGLSPPGTPVAAGLVVPVGAQLVGPAFPQVPSDEPPMASTVAVLQIDGDPFAAWDDLAGQARELGVPIAGSGVCMWRRSRPVAGLEGIPNVDTPVAAPRPDIADVLDCDAAANGPVPDGTGMRVTMNLWWWAEGAELQVEIQEGDVSGYLAAYPGSDPGPAPATAARQLPERTEPISVERGDPFSEENNCFERGYDRLTLPAGARYVGGGTAGSPAVLAVENAEAVLADLRDQLDDPDNPDGDYRLSEERLADGTPIWVLSGGVSGGGGACGMWSSPGGTAVVVTTHSD